jgi:cytidylate kinase
MPRRIEKDTVKQFVNAQLQAWEGRTGERAMDARRPVVALSMEPGSEGCRVAKGLAEQLGYDLFHRSIIHAIAASARTSDRIVESLERDRLSGVQDFISSLINKQYIHPDIYLEHLMKVVATIGKHGRAVVVGRGAGFILPPDECLSIRVIAPAAVRIGNVVAAFNASKEEAKRRIMIRESRRRAFVRQSFNQNINDPKHYDLVINTGRMSISAAVAAAQGALASKFA